MTRRACGAGVLLAVLAASGAVMPAVGERENFESAAEGSLPKGFSAAVGRWEVVGLPEGGKAVAQLAESADPVFNLAFETNTYIRNVDMTVRLRAVAGVNDQGGGLVWRAKDARNYYVARFNPLEENFRVYKVVDGVRTQLQSAGAKRTEGWRTLRVWMFGDHIRCELDGRPLLDVKDGTFSEPGKVGFWTKSDARTRFDDFTRMAFE